MVVPIFGVCTGYGAQSFAYSWFWDEAHRCVEELVVPVCVVAVGMKSPTIPVWVTSSHCHWFDILKELFQVRSLSFESPPINLGLISVMC